MHQFGCGSVWGWGNEAIDVLSKLSKKMATQLCRPLIKVTSTIYSRLSLILMSRGGFRGGGGGGGAIGVDAPFQMTHNHMKLQSGYMYMYNCTCTLDGKGQL